MTKQTKNEENDVGAVSATEVDSVSRSVPTNATPHAAHTPGPWTLRLWMVETATGRIPNVSNDGGRYVMSEQGRIALVDCQTDFKRGQGHLTACAERDANAHLIAAAPEMLNTLKQVLVECYDDGHSQTGKMDDACQRRGQVIRCGICEVLNDVRAAIAKAEGER